jgi:tetratricopeptide (TPR) repeat protein
VGREQELALLRDLLLTTENTAKFKLSGQKKEIAAPFDAQRRPQSVFLLGEVGIGKTRLAEELGRKARQRGWSVAWSRVYAQEGSIPYRLWIDILRKALAQHSGLSPGLSSPGGKQTQGATHATAFPPQLLQHALIYQPLATLLPELRTVLAEVALPSSPPPEQEQLRLWEAVRELLFAISETTPLLIVLDDLQWSDNGSYELLGYLARRLSGQPIIIIGTCRHNELSANSPLRPLLTDLQREHSVEILNLAPLSDDEIRVIVADLLTRTQDMPSHAVPEPTVQRIQIRAAGNPFFAEELARTIVGQPDMIDASHMLHSTTDVPPFLPETITAVLDLRLSRLSPACQRLLSRAAVLGGSFEFPIIAAMESGPSSGSEDVVLDLLEEGLRSGMLSEEGIGSRVTYSFWHPLLVNHLYEGLSAARRASLHRRAAEILLRVYAPNEEEGAAIITHHLMRGGAHSDQIAYFAELAGDRAYRLSAYPDAERHYRTVLEYMSQHADELQHRAYISELVGECIRIQGKFEEARHFYEQALAVRGQIPAGALWVEQEQEAQIEALLWCEIGVTWYDTGDNMQARHCYELGEKVLLEAKVVEGAAWARLRYLQSYASWREGNYEEARSKAHEALKLFEGVIGQENHNSGYKTRVTSIKRTLMRNQVDLGRTYMLLAAIANSVGLSTEALAYLDMALPIFEQQDCQREIAIVCLNSGDIHMKKAENSQAHAALRRSLSLAERIGDIPLLSYVFGNMGVLDTRTSNLTEAETELRHCILLAEGLEDPISVSLWLTHLATALQEQGKLSEAKRVLYRALTIGRTRHIPPCISSALVAVGNIRIAQAKAIDFDEEKTVQSEEKNVRFLKRARRALQHALVLESIEVETKIEGQLALAHVSLLLGEVESAFQQAQQTLEEASRSALTWLVARAQHVLACILVTQGQQEQAKRHFEQVLRMFRKYGMRLEYGRTLQEYGNAMLQWNSNAEECSVQAVACLQEAHQIFTECKAMFDIQNIERVLDQHELLRK